MSPVRRGDVLASLLCAAALAACGGDAERPGAPRPAVADAGGGTGAPPAADLVVYYAWDDDVARVVLEAFAAESGASVDGMRRSIRHLVKIVEAEAEAPVASVLMSGSAASYEMLEAAGLLEAYRPAGAEAIPGEFRDPAGAWTGIYVGVIGFATDARQAPRPPRSYRDLLEMDLPHGLSYANPAASGTAYTFLLGLIAVSGEEEAFRFLGGLHGRVVEYPSGGAVPVRLVQMQEATAAIAFAHDILRARQRDPHVVLSFPEEGTGWEIGAAALLRRAPDSALGRRFLDFLVRPGTQELFWRRGGMPVYPTHPAATPPPGAPPLASLRRARLDPVEAGRRWDERALRWNRLFPRRR
jgi:iron(III) transport system substrate-binding protein